MVLSGLKKSTINSIGWPLLSGSTWFLYGINSPNFEEEKKYPNGSFITNLKIVKCTAVRSSAYFNAVETALHCALQYSAVQCGSVKCSAVQYNADQCCAIQFSALTNVLSGCGYRTLRFMSIIHSATHPPDCSKDMKMVYAHQISVVQPHYK